jgi:hypothetical protein
VAKGSRKYLIKENGVCPIRPSTNTVDSEALVVSCNVIPIVKNPLGETAYDNDTQSKGRIHVLSSHKKVIDTAQRNLQCF